jgi:hypothetical protein
MRVFNRLVLTLSITLALINVVLAFLGQTDISVYFIVDTIGYLIITLTHVYMNPRARGSLNAVAGVIFAGFAVVVAMKIIEILK